MEFMGFWGSCVSLILNGLLILGLSLIYKEQTVLWARYRFYMDAFDRKIKKDAEDFEKFSQSLSSKADREQFVKLKLEVVNKADKNDPAIKAISLALADASKEGEGFFFVKKVDDENYFFRMDPANIMKRGPR